MFFLPGLENIVPYSRAFVANSVWAEKDDFLDVVYWLRQLLGLLVGLAWGVLGVSGAAGIIGKQ